MNYVVRLTLHRGSRLMRQAAVLNWFLSTYLMWARALKYSIRRRTFSRKLDFIEYYFIIEFSDSLCRGLPS